MILSRFAITTASCVALIGCGVGVSQAQSTQGLNWVPQLDATWQWQLTGDINDTYDVDVYDIDLFDTSAATIRDLQAQGRHVVCYFSAGSSEDWRDDFSDFTETDMGSPLDGWAGERWLDTRSENVRTIMAGRLQIAAQKGCDGVEPDNVDGYQNDPGHPLTAQTQLNYSRFLANSAHELGLAIGLKNDVDNVAALAAVFDFAVNEECHEYEECDVYRAFTRLGKPVFNAEYETQFLENENGARDRMCRASIAANIQSLVLAWDLDDSIHYSCDADFAG